MNIFSQCCQYAAKLLARDSQRPVTDLVSKGFHFEYTFYILSIADAASELETEYPRKVLTP